MSDNNNRHIFTQAAVIDIQRAGQLAKAAIDAYGASALGLMVGAVAAMTVAQGIDGEAVIANLRHWMTCLGGSGFSLPEAPEKGKAQA